MPTTTKTKVLNQAVTDRYSLYNADNCEAIKALPSNSIDYTISSPPFQAMYVYSNSERDMGNSRTDEQFSEHLVYLAKELYRVTKPGRLLSLHCMNLPTSKTRDGFIGIKDFRGDLIRICQNAGFIFHSEVVIWKDPVTAMQRTKALGLLHKQVKKDSAMSRQGIPDYLVTMRKPGANDEPVKGRFNQYHGDDEMMVRDIYLEQGTLPNGEPFWHTEQDRDKESVQIWQRYASPVWMDINPSDTLQKASARANEDERHVCLAKGSLVLTYHDGYKPIESIMVGKDLVLTHKGRWMPVIAKKKTSDSAKVVSVDASGVANLRVTPTHKFWARSVNGPKDKPKNRAKSATPEWTKACDLGDPNTVSYVNLKTPPSSLTESSLTVKEWWVIGRWLADGHWQKGTQGRTSLHISAGNHKLDHCLRQMGEMAGTKHYTGSTCTQIRVKDPSAKLRNMLYGFGKVAHEKQIPADAYGLNIECTKSLIDGFMSGDGHMDESTDRWYATSVSKRLMLGMQILIQKVYGVTSTLAKGRPERIDTILGRTVNCKQEWVLTFKKDGARSHSFVNGMGAWKKVKSVADDGYSETWNIQVLEDASYTAEGCIVKNCPLQLGVIRRGLQLWSNPDDVVLDPFSGIASTGVVCMEHGRKYVGFELKKSYFDCGVTNLKQAANAPTQLTLL